MQSSTAYYFFGKFNDIRPHAIRVHTGQEMITFMLKKMSNVPRKDDRSLHAAEEDHNGENAMYT